MGGTYTGVLSTQPSFSYSFPNGTNFAKLTVYTSGGQVANTVQSVYINQQGNASLADAAAVETVVLPETSALHGASRIRSGRPQRLPSTSLNARKCAW